MIGQLAEKCSPMATERNSIYHIFTKFFQDTVLVAEKENNRSKDLIGFVLGLISQTNPEEAYIHLLCVDYYWREKGIAPTLIKEFFKVVKERGCKRVTLITKPVNKKAINFYIKLGFKKNPGYKTVTINGEEVVKDYNGKGEHMIVFQKTLAT